ncbi:M64 family metallopeptidase [Myxococcota bacterium]|nr:M64 family metallopeptidase [Myxococcota bacterium]
MIALLLSSFAFAESLRLTIEIQDGAVQVVDAQRVPGQVQAPPPGDGPTLTVNDAAGRALLTTRLPTTALRSVIFPEGGGASATLTRGQLVVELPWPDGAAYASFDGRALRPSPPPPPAPGVAVAVQSAGPPEERLDLVFLGDGYTESQLDTFAADVDRIVAYLLRVEPYGAYTGLFNIWRVDQASDESGASHYESNPADVRDTAYGCYYGCGGIDRLICCDDDAVLDEVRAAVPGYDGVMVLVNDPTYGGSGGFSYATSYTADPYGSLVAAHELGHSLVGLWDEYSYGTSGSAQGAPNCAKDGDAPQWSAWLGEDGVDAFKPCSYTNLYRPTNDACMMNTLQDDYCPVCREQAVLAIYGQLPGVIYAESPAQGTLTLAPDVDHSLSVSTLGPDDGSLAVVWDIDGKDVGEGAEFTLKGCVTGAALRVRALDPTAWVRVDEAGVTSDERVWSLDTTACPPVAEDSGAGGDSAGGGGDSVSGGDKRGGRCGCAGLTAPGGLSAAILAILVARRRRSQLC